MFRAASATSGAPRRTPAGSRYSSARRAESRDRIDACVAGHQRRRQRDREVVCPTAAGDRAPPSGCRRTRPAGSRAAAARGLRPYSTYQPIIRRAGRGRRHIAVPPSGRPAPGSTPPKISNRRRAPEDYSDVISRSPAPAWLPRCHRMSPARPCSWRELAIWPGGRRYPKPPFAKCRHPPGPARASVCPRRRPMCSSPCPPAPLTQDRNHCPGDCPPRKQRSKAAPQGGLADPYRRGAQIAEMILFPKRAPCC